MTSSKNSTPFVAEEYDKSIRRVIPFYDIIQAETIDVVKTVKPGVKQWLDTGCGTGYLVEKAALLFPDATFILSDPSEDMITAAAQRLQAYPDHRVKFLPPTPTEGLPAHIGEFKPQVITAVLSHHYYHPQQRRIATGICYSLLESGGLYITVENVMPDSAGGIQLSLQRWKRFQIEHGRTKEKVEEHGKRFNSEYFPVTINEHFELLKETGFQTIELYWKSHIQAGFYAVK
jgi:tRNA (cmo5U34)-methyltransferase